MLNLHHIVALIIINIIVFCSAAPFVRQNGGVACAACTLGITLTGHMAQVHNASIAESLARICNLLESHPSYEQHCDEVIQYSAPFIIELLYHKYKPDVICTALDVCGSTSSGQPACHLFAQSQDEVEDTIAARAIVKKHLKKTRINGVIPPFCEWPGMKFFCQIIDRFLDDHLPLFDEDGDGFSPSESFRGTAWRGKDCNDWSSQHHPGAKPINDDIDFDSNCNGIYGVNHETGRPYETELCGDTGPRGVMLLGDSAGAHFHLPEQYLYAPTLTANIMSHLPYIIENEFDWPMLSAVTGYRNITWSIVDNFTESLYGFMRQRNRCNHRDFQNLGVNGADSGSFLHYWNSVKRNQSTDYPVVAAYEFVGNDVCNPHTDTIAHMTTREQIRKNALGVLDKLDATLPHGSHVVLIGLADGRYLWESMHRRLHPLGRLNGDIRYPAFYEFLSCVGCNPCNGWMTANETLRELTSERSYELSMELKKIALESQNKYRNFDVVFLDCPLNDIMYNWQRIYGPESGWQLIEPVDGFHPNKLANNLFARFVWNYMLHNRTSFIGDENPNNRRIDEIFGDQGGY